MLISNYELGEKLAEAPQAAVFKAFRKGGPDRPLVLKILKSGSLSDRRKLQIRQKLEHLKVLEDPRVITPLSFGDDQGVSFLAQDWFDGMTLDAFTALRGGRVATEEFLTIAVGIASALEKVHEAGIIHGGIKPHNILVNPASLDIRLIDFIGAVDIRDVSHFIYESSFIRGTLAYTSPEQTGRISHRVVFASDLYCLGVVFHEMLTGCLPFQATDPLDLIHKHLAEEPAKVHQLRPEVPAAIGTIVATLLLKEPEKRYQSGMGLARDLERARDEYARLGTIRSFALESGAVTRRVTFISKMVGREKESSVILEEYEQASRGTCRSVFISGLSGIGKTRLIQELQKPIVRHRGYFTSGKFDIYQRNIPYSSLIQAFRNLMRTFLTESNERVALWKERVRGAVGDNGRVLTDVIQELELLIGPQPELKPLPPVEALNRFHDTFDRFLSCLATAENPLVLFIDDLQWCDSASFDFLSNVLENFADHPHLLLLGAYRHNEVEAGHPLSRMIRTAAEKRWPLEEVRLGPLELRHCHEMVSYILDSPPAETRALSEFISGLSEGNPLFVSESLSYLHGERLLRLDEARQWRWDLARIRQTRMPTTVVALFSSKIRRLPPEPVEMLKYCACMGNAFTPSEVAAVRGMALRETFEVLKPALREGLLVENRSQYQFIHDRVQEAVLVSIAAGERRRIHREVGGCLLAAAGGAEADLSKADSLFTIVSHLNAGVEEHPDVDTAYQLAALNFHAGTKALSSLATQAANEYFNRAMDLLPRDCWGPPYYERTFRIFQRAAKTELMCGNYPKSERLLSVLLEHAATDLDKAECLAEQTTSLSSIGNFIKAIETANRGLAYFDKAIPGQAQVADARREELMGRIASEHADVWGTILAMPFTRDRRSKIELAFYSELIPDLYMSGLVPQLYLSAAQSTEHCLAGGMDESVIYSFSIMGLQLGELGRFAEAFKYEDLARDLSAKYPDTFGATRGMNGIVWCNAHSRSHPREIADYCLKSIQCGKNCGDLYNAGLSYGPLMWNLQVQGADFAAIEETARECLQFSNRYHLSFSVGLAEAMQAGWIEPMKRSPALVPMEQKLRQWEADNHVASAGSYCVHRALAHYYLGEYPQAQQHLDAVRKYLSGLTDNVLKRQWYVFLALNALKLHEAADRAGGREQLLSQVQPLVRKVEAWAALGPLLQPYLALLHAELARVTGESRDARTLYLDAIDSAHSQGYVFLEGYAHECLGEAFLQAGYRAPGAYFREAARLYQACGAEAKEWRLRERRPDQFEEERRRLRGAEGEPAEPRGLPSIDADYLMKSALALSAETDLDQLLVKIMDVTAESSGAQHGYLLALHGGELFVRAETHVGVQQVARVAQRRLEDSPDICKAIVRYVFRTGERVVLSNACEEEAFRDSAEVQELRLRSVLCLPVVRQAQLIGVLYLENRLSDGIFGPEKARVTELLTSQAAISLENARLIEELHAQRERLRVTLASIGDAVLVTDTSGCVTFLNSVAAEITGWPLEGAVGEPIRDVFRIINEQSRAPAEDVVGRVLREGRVVGLANGTILVARDGREIPIEDSAAPILDPAGKTAGVVLVFHDVTEKRQSHRELERRAVQLARSNDDLKHFAYACSHDLQEPLRTVSGFLTLLSHGYRGRLDQKADEYISFAVDGSKRMSAMISDLLAYSRVDRSDRKISATSAERALSSALANLASSIEAAGAVVTRDSLPTLVADGAQLVQLLQNLVGNAVKFRAEGRPCKVHVGVRRDGCDWILSVQDNGIGISPEYYERIFVLFQRLHSRERYKGTGIGLAMCKRIVERHGGRIWVESRIGEGSTFCFTWRADPAGTPVDSGGLKPAPPQSL